MTASTPIGAVLDEFAAALYAKDAYRVIATLSEDATFFDLAPPLALPPEATHDPSGLEQWFATWAGPIVSEARYLKIAADGDVAFAYGLRHMTGTKTGGEMVDLWFRATVGLRRQAGDWRIAHLHESVPFAMDGSDRALLDLKP